ncbi:hypothetical protein DFH09DRAFT_1178499 [Mycena vulgaris]|nr:hypothetical protein DFH09DRAFT_1178499 [Mycena vulgaris]
MAPTLRSSSSPAATRTTRNSTKSAPPPDLRSPTPRKPRCCTSCKRPRLGHPREGCPFAEDATQNENTPASDSPTRSVAAALDALDLTEAEADSDEENAESRKPRKPFTRMPGTLLTPTPSMYSYSQSSQLCKDETPPAFKDASFASSSSSIPYLGLSQLSEPAAPTPRAESPMDDDDSGRATPPPATATAIRPLIRTLTSDERAEFTASLSNLAKATVYVLPTPDVSAIRAAAAERALHTRELELDHADTLLVVGLTAEATAVLFYQVEAKMHALVPRTTGKARATATRGALLLGVGAAVTWSALAFS